MNKPLCSFALLIFIIFGCDIVQLKGKDATTNTTNSVATGNCLVFPVKFNAWGKVEKYVLNCTNVEGKYLCRLNENYRDGGDNHPVSVWEETIRHLYHKEISGTVTGPLDDSNRNLWYWEDNTSKYYLHSTNISSRDSFWLWREVNR